VVYPDRGRPVVDHLFGHHAPPFIRKP
jgi:hypothetical protein